jgi:hypothetical protein
MRKYFMRSALVVPALMLIAACGGGPTKQEENLSERGEGAEQLANGASTTAAQENLGDTMPKQPGGPTSDRGSGSGGDTAPSQ